MPHSVDKWFALAAAVAAGVAGLRATRRKPKAQMNCMYLGHAGWLIQTADCRVLCDPWHSDNPVFFDAWSPYPANDELDWEHIRNTATVLYISHNHRDHLDLANLRLLPNKSIPVVVPQLRYALLREELQALGFTNLISGEYTVGNTVMRTFVSETTNREMEDSMLLIDDGETSFLNANDCKLEGHIQAELAKQYPKGVSIYTGQFSGAAWHPMAYAGNGSFTPDRVAQLCRAHCSKTVRRFISACRAVKAHKCVPGSGPAAFLSEDLFQYNYVSSESVEHCIFPDAYQVGFEELWDCDGALCRVAVGSQFTYQTLTDLPEDPIPDKISYLRQRMRPVPDPSCEQTVLTKAIHDFQVHLQEILQHFGEKLATVIQCKLYVLLEGPEATQWIEIVLGEGASTRRIAAETLEEPYYALRMPQYIFVDLVANQHWDWEEAFLGLRCKFERQPDLYNSWILAFFKNLTMQRMGTLCESLESTSKQTMAAQKEQFFERDGFRIPRYCPHQGMDLMVHGRVSDGKLTCLGHGFEWDLKSGQGTNNTCQLACTALEW